MKAVMWTYGSLEVKDVPIPPISKDEVLCKTILAEFSDIDALVMRGLVPYMPNCTAGSIALVRALEVGVDCSNVDVGGMYFIKPLCNGLIYGVNADGFLREYSSARAQCLVRFVGFSDVDPLELISFEYSFLESLSRYLDAREYNDILIVGHGVGTYVVSNLLSRAYNVTVAYNVNDRVREYITSLGIKVVKPYNIESTYDAVVITSPTYTLDMFKHVRVGGSIIITPLNPSVIVPHLGRYGEVSIFIPDYPKIYREGMLRDAIDNGLIRKTTIVTNNLNDVPLLIRSGVDKVVVSLT